MGKRALYGKKGTFTMYNTNFSLDKHDGDEKPQEKQQATHWQ